MKINREKLLGRLQSVQAGLAKRELLEQSTCICFTRGYAMTFNDEVYCRVKSDLGKDFAGAVAAKPLLSLIEKYPDEEVDISAGDGKLIIKGLAKSSKIIMEQEVLLAIDAVEEPGEWKPLPPEFEEAVKLVASCASNNVELVLNSVHIHPKWIEAHDNYQITRYKIKIGIEKPFLVRSGSLKHVCQLGMTEFSESEAWLHFKNADGLILSCRRFIDEYVDMTKFLDVKGETVVLPTGLEEAVKRTQVFSEENENKNVRVQLRAGKCKITGEGVTGSHSELKKLRYTGPELDFLVSTAMLLELPKRGNECVVTTNRLAVTGGKWRYVATLHANGEENNHVAEAPEEESEEV